MKVLLIDVDSTIPNLALMKISAYHKSIGDKVGFNISDPDKVYASVIFKKNRHLVDGLQFLYPNSEIDIGGSGVDLDKKLPQYIEDMTPNYELYPTCDRYYGFTTRGCIRNCHFCIVPKKEGKFRHAYESIAQALFNITGGDNCSINERFHKIEFLDNNILADKEWFTELCNHLIFLGWKVDFNQGLDIRLIDKESAILLSQLKPITCWKFAFDNINYVDKVEKGIAILNSYGVNVRNKVMFYVYVHDDDSFEDALYRCRKLKELGATPYPMLNKDVPHTKRMKNLKRWCRPWIFWSIDFDQYTVKVGDW